MSTSSPLAEIVTAVVTQRQLSALAIAALVWSPAAHVSDTRFWAVCGTVVVLVIADRVFG